ncbi:MAG: cupin domain-containing protein [Pseudomonadota bacterium]
MAEIIRAGRPTMTPNPDYFTGTVFMDPIHSAPAPARVAAVRVTFTPGARTAWHKHPYGQTLYIVAGVGRFAVRGQEVQEIRAGDVVWIPPGEEHWHGAGPETLMSHVAMQEKDEAGSTSTWLDKVTDEDYAGL